MKKSEVAALFALIAFYDARVQFDEGKLEAWNLALDEDMPFDFAKSIIVNHYADLTTAIMPANLNEKWRIARRDYVKRDFNDKMAVEREQANSVAVPCPPDIREQLLKTFSTLSKTIANPSRTQKAGGTDATVAGNQRESASNL